MVTFLKLLSREKILTQTADCILFILASLFYYLYVFLNVMPFAIAFTFFGVTIAIIRLFLKKRRKNLFDKRVWLFKDLTSIVFTALIGAIVVTATGSFDLSYNSHLILNLLFLVLIVFVVSFDFSLETDDL